MCLLHFALENCNFLVCLCKFTLWFSRGALCKTLVFIACVVDISYFFTKLAFLRCLFQRSLPRPPPGGHFGGLWVSPGGSWGLLGAPVGLLWTPLGTPWELFGASWGPLGSLLDAFGELLGGFGEPLSALRVGGNGRKASSILDNMRRFKGTQRRR